MSDKIIITDPKIIAYYASNKNINIVTINHIFIDILNKLSTNLANITEDTINSRILQIVTDINANMNSFSISDLARTLVGLQATSSEAKDGPGGGQQADRGASAEGKRGAEEANQEED